MEVLATIVVTLIDLPLEMGTLVKIYRSRRFPEAAYQVPTALSPRKENKVVS